MIIERADQTNLLALNASNEATRAGEAGEGFAVVTNKIKGLTEEVADATTEIEQRNNATQATTTATVEGMEAMSERVEREPDTIEDAIEMFDEIANAVGEAESGIREICDATDDQATSSEEVVAMVDEVSSVSQQTVAEASNVSDATEEQTTSLSEVSENVQDLSQLSETLHHQVSMFDIRGDGVFGGVSATDPAGQPSVQADGGRSSTPENGSDSAL